MKLESRAVLLPQDHLLIRELNHRINNEYMSAAGMLSLAAARTGSSEAKAALNEVMKRLEDYARVHRAMRMPESGASIDASSYLLPLCQSISRSRLERKSIILVFAGQPLTLAVQQCWLLGMIVYELVNNAARHAFDETGGQIRVEISGIGDYVECRVSDDGAGTLVVGKEGGLGIVRKLAASLGGVFEQRRGTTGRECTVMFPIKSPLSACECDETDRELQVDRGGLKLCAVDSELIPKLRRKRRKRMDARGSRFNAAAWPFGSRRPSC